MKTAACLLAFAAAAHALSAQRLAKPTIDTLDHHVVRVMNHGPTKWADTNGWKLVYERTVQPKEGAGEITDPETAVLLDDGRLIVSDNKPISVRLFDAHGQLVRTIGRAGGGPGEYRAAYPALFHDTLVIHDPAQSRILIMSLDGKIVRQFPSVCCNFAPITVDSFGRIRVAGSINRNGNIVRQWLYFDWSGRRIDSLVTPQVAAASTWTVRKVHPGGGSSSTTYGVPLLGLNLEVDLRDGSVLYGGGDRNLLFVTRRGSDTVREFGRDDLRPITAPAKLRDSLFQQLVDHSAEARSVASLPDVPTVFPAWEELYRDGLSNVWVLRNGQYLHQPRFDVYAPDGVLRGEVPVPFAKGYIMAWSRDHIAVYDTDENDLPRIRIYRIDRRSK